MLYVARCILEMKTPLHCGEGSDDGLLDAPVARDAYGFWRIPGSSVAGIFRSWLRNHAGKNLEERLFGKAEGEDESSSLVWCSDAVLLDYDHTPAWYSCHTGKTPQLEASSFIRDHVRLDQETGSAEKGGKFDEEYVPAGTRFAFEISLDGWMQEPDAEAVQAFSWLLQALKEESLHFGAHSGCGYGTYSVVSLATRKFDLTKPKDAQDWLKIPYSAGLPEDLGQPWQPETSIPPVQHEGLSGTISIPFRTSGPILIAGGAPTDNVDADMCFAQTASYEYDKKKLRFSLVLPGSSLRGVIRHRAFQIMKDLGWKDPEKEIDCLFGMTKGNESHRGLMGFSDAPLIIEKNRATMGSCKVVQHVSIDRFTGGAMDAHLFNEAPVWKENVSFTLSLRLDGITPEQAGILLHAIIDMAEGTLPIGNGVNRGNGRIALDTTKPIQHALFWNTEKLSSDNQTEWLKKISVACKEKCNATM